MMIAKVGKDAGQRVRVSFNEIQGLSIRYNCKGKHEKMHKIQTTRIKLSCLRIGGYSSSVIFDPIALPVPCMRPTVQKSLCYSICFGLQMGLVGASMLYCVLSETLADETSAVGIRLELR